MPSVFRAIDRRGSQVSRRISVRERFPLAWSGVRGGVSLAGALAVPDTTADGRPFEYKSLIVFITAGVIVVTLFGQGMSLPRVIKWAHYDSVDDSAGQRTAEIALTEEGLRYVTDPAQRDTAPPPCRSARRRASGAPARTDCPAGGPGIAPDTDTDDAPGDPRCPAQSASDHV